jgi:purine-binding chemotaxis protein CheW
MADEVHIVLMQVGQHRCGLPADDVAEVVHAIRIVALPGAPAAVEGVINLRGTVVPVFDLRQRFGLERRPLKPQDRLVIMESAGRSIALRADHALDLVTVPSEDLEQAPTVDSGRGDATGVVRLPDGLVVICDPATFISGDEAIVLDELLAASDIGRT